jgi:hypothetical protein
MSKATDQSERSAKEFTSLKFDWLDAVAVDPRVRAAAFKVAYCIMQHVNAQTMVAILSDEVIHDKTDISLPEVKRHRAALRDAGWLSWTRSKTANRYTPLYDKLGAAQDLLLLKKEARDERRVQRRERGTPTLPDRSPAILPKPEDSSPAIPENIEDGSPAILPDRSPAILRDRSPATNIHLTSYTLEVTPSKEGLPIERFIEAVPESQEAKVRLIELLGEGDAERGLGIAVAIGDHRFDFLRRELMHGELSISTIQAAICRRGINEAAA